MGEHAWMKKLFNQINSITYSTKICVENAFQNMKKIENILSFSLEFSCKFSYKKIGIQFRLKKK